jgi:hypothetical protein
MRRTASSTTSSTCKGPGLGRQAKLNVTTHLQQANRAKLVAANLKELGNGALSSLR